MPGFAGVIVVAVISLASLLIFGVWGLPVFLVLVPLLLLYLFVGRTRDGRPVGVVERGRRPEPTGRPRPASGGADTANERVGQG